MTKRFLLAAAALLTIGACSESPAAPRTLKPGAASRDEACRAGYHIATRDDGTSSCEPNAVI